MDIYNEFLNELVTLQVRENAIKLLSNDYFKIVLNIKHNVLYYKFQSKFLSGSLEDILSKNIELKKIHDISLNSMKALELVIFNESKVNIDYIFKIVKFNHFFNLSNIKLPGKFCRTLHGQFLDGLYSYVDIININNEEAFPEFFQSDKLSNKDKDEFKNRFQDVLMNWTKLFSWIVLSQNKTITLSYKPKSYEVEIDVSKLINIPGKCTERSQYYGRGLIIYKDDKDEDFYCLSLDKLIKDFSNKIFLNPYSGKSFNNEFIRKISERYAYLIGNTREKTLKEKEIGEKEAKQLKITVLSFNEFLKKVLSSKPSEKLVDIVYKELKEAMENRVTKENDFIYLSTKAQVQNDMGSQKLFATDEEIDNRIKKKYEENRISLILNRDLFKNFLDKNGKEFLSYFFLIICSDIKPFQIFNKKVLHGIYKLEKEYKKEEILTELFYNTDIIDEKIDDFFNGFNEIVEYAYTNTLVNFYYQSYPSVRRDIKMPFYKFSVEKNKNRLNLFETYNPIVSIFIKDKKHRKVKVFSVTTLLLQLAFKTESEKKDPFEKYALEIVLAKYSKYLDDIKNKKKAPIEVMKES